MLATDRTIAMMVATALGAARLTPVLWMVGAFGGPRLPAMVRVGFALLLAAIASPLLAGTAAATVLADASTVRLSLAMAREVIVGFCLGFVTSAVFRAAEMAGRLGDTLRGANIAEVLVPTTDERSSPLGALYLLLATLVFFQIGGVPRLLEALLSSYQALPLGGGLSVAGSRNAAFVIAAASAKLITSGVALAAPVIVAVWLTDIALGLIARAAPQIPVYFVGLPLKGLLALGVVLLGLGALQAALVGEIGGWFRILARVIVTFAG